MSPAEAASPLRAALEAVISERGCSLKDLTVLATQNDPFRVDTPARHRDGEWLAARRVLVAHIWPSPAVASGIHWHQLPAFRYLFPLSRW